MRVIAVLADAIHRYRQVRGLLVGMLADEGPACGRRVRFGAVEGHLEFVENLGHARLVFEMADGAEHHDEDERREGHVEGDEVESELFEHAEILGRELRCGPSLIRSGDILPCGWFLF